MATIGAEAIDKLSTTLEELLPAGADTTLEVHPLRIVPTGLGGFVGLSHGPEGEIVGRRLEASARIAVKAASVDALGAAVSAVTSALLAPDRGSLRSQGVLRLELETLGPKPAADTAGAAEREIQFKVLYEFLKLPEETGDVIERIPIDLELGRGVPPRRLISVDFGNGSLPSFDIVDDSSATTRTPSIWQENAADERIQETSGITSGSVAANSNNPGTYLVLKTHPSRPAAKDVLLRTTLRSGGQGGMGLVFRWQDEKNFYYFLMNEDAKSTYRVLGRKVEGVFQDLETPALDKVNGFEVDHLYDVKLVAEGPVFQVYLDGERILEGRDAALAGPGRVGLMSRNNKQAFFYRFSAVQL